MNRCFIPCAVHLAVFLMTSTLLAKPGLVKTRDGRTLEGEVTEMADAVTVSIHGIATQIALKDIASIQYADDVDKQYKEKVAALSKTPSVKDHLDIARWLMENKSYELAAKEVSAAQHIDPSDVEAALLGKTIQNQLHAERARPHDDGAPSTKLASATQPVKSPEQIFQDLQKAAARNGRAMGELANCYADGIGTSKDVKLAFEWFGKGAKVGDRRSMRGMGFCYERGWGTKIDLAKAFEWYEKAAKAGDPLAMESLGFCYSRGRGVPLDWRRAIDSYEKAASAGDTHAMVLVANCYKIGLGELTVSPGSDMRVMVEPDARKYQQKTMFYYTRAADAGDPAGMMSLGALYEEGGPGVRVDRAKAVSFYKRAAISYEKSASAGDPEAMQFLAYCYEYGKGVPKDLPKAIEWYQKAVKGGDTGAMCSLGMCYAAGSGIAKDESMALQLFEQAAAAGDPVGMRCVGYCYKNGVGAAQNYGKALRYFHLGERAGDGASLREIGVCNETGVGARTNISTAIDCYFKGSAFGDPVAMYELGRCCACGIGVTTDLSAARSWISRSANAGYAPAKKLLPNIQNAILNQQFKLLAEAMDDFFNPPYDPDEAQRQQGNYSAMMRHREKYRY